MNKADYYYLKNLKEILKNGQWDENPRPKWKDGTPAHSKFIGPIFEEYNISKGEFPISTLRNTAIKMGIKEIFWIYQLQSNKLSDAHDLGITWWDDFNIGDNTIGQRYGATVDRYNLMNLLLDSLKNNQFSRRHIINLYQYEDLNETDGLDPCAYETLWSIRKINDDFYVDMTLMQRSNDYIVANQINKIQYVALLQMVCSHLGYKPGKFYHIVQNLHIYDRHIGAAKEILNKEPLNIQPTIRLKNQKNFYDFNIDDFEILNIDKIRKIKSPLEIAI